MSIAAILRAKGSTVVSVPPQASMAEVARVLSEARIGAALVQDNAGQLLGIVSERDVVHGLARHGTGLLGMSAAQLMTSQLRTATPSTSEAEAMAMMTEGRFRHVPVLDGDRLVGMISIGDVVKARIQQTEHEVDSLKAYVAGAA